MIMKNDIINWQHIILMSAVYKTYAKNETKIISEVYLYIIISSILFTIRSNLLQRLGILQSISCFIFWAIKFNFTDFLLVYYRYVDIYRIQNIIVHQYIIPTHICTYQCLNYVLMGIKHHWDLALSNYY